MRFELTKRLPGQTPVSFHCFEGEADQNAQLNISPELTAGGKESDVRRSRSIQCRPEPGPGVSRGEA